MQGECNGTTKLTMHLSDMVAVCKEISCATDAVPTAEVCRTFFQDLGVLVDSEEDFNYSLNEKLWDHFPGTVEFSPTLMFIILSVVLCLFASVAPSAKFYKIFHSRRAGNMAEPVVDLKKWEAAIFSGNANQSEEAYKILKDYISDKKPGNRKFYFMACTYELRKGNMDNVYSYVRLSKIRCIGDKYVDFIGKKYDTTWSVADAKKHVLHLFENPEKNITFDAQQTVVHHNLETIEQNQYEHRLKDACDNFNQGNVKKCLELFKEGLDLAKRSKIQIDTATDQGIKFISAMAHVKIGTITSYKSALDTYKTLIGIKSLKDEKDIANAGQAEKMPMAMIGLAMLLEKLYRFKLGLKVVERGLDILDRKGSTIINYTWPGSDVELPYGTLEYMKEEFDKLKDRFAFPPKPTAVCRYAKCLDHQSMPCRDIYLGEPEFVGYVTISCEASCKVSYHCVCWKEYKEAISTNHQSRNKINDRDILGTVCPTEDCYKINNSEKIPNKIIEFTIYDKDGSEKSSRKKDYTPEPEVPVPAPPPPQPKKKSKKKPMPAAADPGASTSKVGAPAAAKVSPTKVNRGNLWVTKLGSAEPDENAITNTIVKKRLPSLREKIGILPTLIEVTKNEKSTATMQKQLWYLSVRDWVTNNQGAMKKEDLHTLFADDLRAVTDYKKIYFVSEDRRGAISKTEFFGHLLTSDEFGCIDEWVCLVNQVQEESNKVASEFQELYGKLFKVKFVPKERPKSMSPAPAARVNQERRDSIRERRDSDRTSDQTTKDSDRERKNSDRERRDSLRERSNSISLSDKNGIVKIANDGDSNSRVSTPEPTKVQTNGKNQINPEQVVSTAKFLESEFKTSDGASVYNSLSMPVVTETKSEKRNSVVSNEEIQLDLVVPTDSEQLEEANRKIAELQKQLSEAKAKCLDTEQKLEDYQRDAHLNTLEIAKIRGDHREKENKLNDTIKTLTSDKAKEIKAKEDMQKTLDDMKKELAELRKKVDSAESSKSKKKKQDETCGAAMQKVIYHIDKHWDFINQSLHKEKTEKESLVYGLLEDLHECTSQDTYTAVLVYVQQMETFIMQVEDHGRRLKDRLAAVKDAPKNPEQHWATLSKIDLPQLPNMPESVILGAVIECIKKYAALLKRQAEAQTQAQALTDAPTPAPVEVPQPAPPSPSLPIFEQVPQNVAQRQESPGPSHSAHSDEMGACALPTRSLLPPRLDSRKMPTAPFNAPPPFPNLRQNFGMGPQAAPSMYPNPNPSPSYMPFFMNPPPQMQHAPPAHPPPPQPFFAAPPPKPAVQEAPRQPPAAQRSLLPSSVINHVNQVTRPTRNPTMADSFKRPNAPQISTRAYRLPASDLQITAYRGFAELEQELFMISQLIPHASQNDLRQALHWLCLRRSGEEVRSLEPDKLQSELCTILTEMLMTASAEEINGEESEVVKSVTERPSLDCPICFDSFREDAKSIHQLPCSHLFHKPCIRNWLEMGDNKGCPVCRGTTVTTSPNHHFPPLHGGRR